jgi:hypothetical protein
MLCTSTRPRVGVPDDEAVAGEPSGHDGVVSVCVGVVDDDVSNVLVRNGGGPANTAGSMAEPTNERD